MLFMTILSNQNGIDAVMMDYFDIVGTTATTLVCIYDLFIIKFIEIFTVKEGKRKSKAISL